MKDVKISEREVKKNEGSIGTSKAQKQESESIYVLRELFLQYNFHCYKKVQHQIPRVNIPLDRSHANFWGSSYSNVHAHYK